MKTILFFLCLGLAVSAFAQPIKRRDDCGTLDPAVLARPSDEQLAQIQQKATLPICIRAVVTVFANNDGSNRAATDDDVRRQFENMANQYAPHNICFILQDIRQVNNSDLNDQVDSTEANEVYPFRVPNVLNIFIHNNLPGLNGTAYSVLNFNAYVSLSGATIGDLDNISTMGHEVGHVFGLPHTHAGIDGAEHVARTGNCQNCGNTGDYYCDTPADPNQDVDLADEDYLADNTSVGCVYTGLRTDACGVRYTPDVRNMMAYGRRSCRIQFSASQAQSMRFWLSQSQFAYIEVADDNLSIPFFVNTTRNNGSYINSARDQITVSENNTFTVTGTADQIFQAKRIIWRPGTQISPASGGRTRATANPYCQ